MGNIGKIETKFTAAGTGVTSLSIAVNENWTDKQGNKQEHTEWVRATAFGKQSEVIAQYVNKGDPLYISGKMKTDKYQAQDGTDRYSTSVIIREFQFLKGRPEAGSGASNQSQSPQAQNNSIQMPDKPDPSFEMDDVPF